MISLNNFVKEVKKDIYLSNSDIEILKRYEIDYANFNNMKELIFYLNSVINNYETNEDLEDLLIKLSEYNYYFRTNK